MAEARNPKIFSLVPKALFHTCLSHDAGHPKDNHHPSSETITTVFRCHHWSFKTQEEKRMELSAPTYQDKERRKNLCGCSTRSPFALFHGGPVVSTRAKRSYLLSATQNFTTELKSFIEVFSRQFTWGTPLKY